MYRTRYSDGTNNHDLHLETNDVQDVEEYDDYYENRPGDAISRTTKPHGTSRGSSSRSILALGLLTMGTILILLGIGYSMVGGNQQPGGQRGFVPPPTEAPDAFETSAPSHGSMYGFVTSLIGTEILEDSESIAYKAMEWMEDEQFNSIDRFQNHRLRQRFALACLFISTNEDETWANKDMWMSAESECTWYGVKCKNHKLISLNLTANGLEGIVPSEIAFLKDDLLALDLSRNEVSNKNHQLSWIAELDKLRMLDVERTLFAYDGVPPYISNLKDLQFLDMGESLFVGNLDGSIFKPLTNLLYLEIGGNLFNSTVPSEIYNLPKLEAFYAYESGLRGDLSFIPSMNNIFELWLDDNPELVGSIPTEIGQVSTLASLSVSSCGLSGQIPTEIGKLTLMQQMWFFGNWFSGSIPAEFSNLSLLKILGLEDNDIMDVAMPQEICAMDLISLSADCGDKSENLVQCSCCTCCEFPCPVANLPVYDHSTRKLALVDSFDR